MFFDAACGRYGTSCVLGGAERKNHENSSMLGSKEMIKLGWEMTPVTCQCFRVGKSGAIEDDSFLG